MRDVELLVVLEQVELGLRLVVDEVVVDEVEARDVVVEVLEVELETRLVVLVVTAAHTTPSTPLAALGDFKELFK